MWQDRQAVLRRVKESLGLFRIGMAGKVGYVEERTGTVRTGRDWQDRQVPLRSVKESFGMVCIGAEGKVKLGEAVYVMARFCIDRLGMAGGFW